MKQTDTRVMHVGLLREIGFIAAVAFAIGSVIGSGIFKKPGLMAAQLPSPPLLVLVWVVAGLMTLFGTLSIAEIAGMFHEAGGQYVYFNRCYNDFVGYLYGWAVFVVIQTGSIASIAYVFSDSLAYFVKLPHLGKAWENFAIHLPGLGAITPFKSIGLKLCTIGLLLFLTTVNYLGVKLGSVIQVLFTGLKIAVILAIVILAFALGGGPAPADLAVSMDAAGDMVAPALPGQLPAAAVAVSTSPASIFRAYEIGGGSMANFSRSAIPAGTSPGALFLLIIVAMSGAFWAYDGWINITYVAGEIKNPQRNMPRVMFVAALVFISVYILVNLAYLYIIPVNTMGLKNTAAEATGGSYLVATDVASSFLGRWGGGLIALAIMISTFGTVNGTIMLSARVYFAMAREKLFFHKLGHVHPRFRTPGPSLAWQGIWASFLVLSGTFDQLTDMLIFVSWIFYALGALGVIVLRRKMPDAPRPYRVWGYPVVPWLFVAFAAVYVVFTLYSDVRNFTSGKATLINSLFGIVLVALGIPGYLYWNRKRRRTERLLDS